MSNCDRWANHDLIVVYSAGTCYDEEQVVRWCETCGAVVVDIDVDNITHPGAIVKMKVPNIVKNQLVKEGKLNA